ncbi:MAG: formate--tetrahydrofolate ligase [Chitinivibrionia bacterium]|nr:formate--tetrahydrofolate ligase [Chitinivibrionia bacterium]
MKTDIEIDREAKLEHIASIAQKIGLAENDIELYGKYKAKLNLNAAALTNAKRRAKIILVTAITPTPAGEGKTTTTVGIGDALARLKKNVIICLREPSLGPVFGIKGGAAGGGYAQIVPMEDINLHFTGDLHAITSANNLLAAMIDNHIWQGNALNIDPRRVTWRRAVDLNDRQLRFYIGGLNGKSNGTPREDGFDITAASEVMAVFCLSENITALKENLSKIIIGYTYGGAPVTAGDLRAHGAMTTLLKDALKPNLVQTLEHTPAFVHGGPFANIAHGCNSAAATLAAVNLADYVVTEAGFGADLGAEKFIDVKCRRFGLQPSVAVVVATVRALKHHGGDDGSLKEGVANLKRHIENMTKRYGLPCVAAINRFPSDTQEDLNYVCVAAESFGATAAISDVYERGGEGGVELAEKILGAVNSPNNFRYLYDTNLPVTEKIETIVRNIYGADGVTFSAEATRQIKNIEKLGYGSLPVCIAKTQYSFTDNAKKICAPTGFKINVRQIRLSAGAGFVVAIAGDIMTMPGLPKNPAAEMIDVDDKGVISGLF